MGLKGPRIDLAARREVEFNTVYGVIGAGINTVYGMIGAAGIQRLMVWC